MIEAKPITLKPIKLHAIVENCTDWTDEIWEAALDYLLQNTATPDAIVMANVLYGAELTNWPHKIDFLREFRVFPPTVLLGAYDLMRYRKEAEHRLAKVAAAERAQRQWR